VNWTYLERAQGDRDHHFMPSNPGIYAWATSEADSKMHDQISAQWSVPKNFTCATGKVVGRWLWKTGSSCNDNNNVGRKTEKFVASEFAKVVDDFRQGAWVKAECTVPPETFISCFDFMMAGVAPSPAPPPPKAPSRVAAGEAWPFEEDELSMNTASSDCSSSESESEAPAAPAATAPAARPMPSATEASGPVTSVPVSMPSGDGLRFGGGIFGAAKDAAQPAPTGPAEEEEPNSPSSRSPSRSSSPAPAAPPAAPAAAPSIAAPLPGHADLFSRFSSLDQPKSKVPGGERPDAPPGASGPPPAAPQAYKAPPERPPEAALPAWATGQSQGRQREDGPPPGDWGGRGSRSRGPPPPGPPGPPGPGPPGPPGPPGYGHGLPPPGYPMMAPPPWGRPANPYPGYPPPPAHHGYGPPPGHRDQGRGAWGAAPEIGSGWAA